MPLSLVGLRGGEDVECFLSIMAGKSRKHFETFIRGKRAEVEERVRGRFMQQAIPTNKGGVAKSSIVHTPRFTCLHKVPNQ